MAVSSILVPPVYLCLSVAPEPVPISTVGETGHPPSENIAPTTVTTSLERGQSRANDRRNQQKKLLQSAKGT